MINNIFLKQLKQDYQNNDSERRQIISTSNNILFLAKKIIFTLQRQDLKIAEDKIKNLENELKKLTKKFGTQRLQKEGAYRAAVEEYLEGKTFYTIIKGKKIKAVSGLNLNYESYLGGICDMIGELVRYATNQAAKGNFSEVAKIKKIANDLMAQIVDFDFTGYLRTKYDQARGHLRKLEQMAYEIRLRKEK